MHWSEAWPALRGTGVASLRQQPLSPSLLFFWATTAWAQGGHWSSPCARCCSLQACACHFSSSCRGSPSSWQRSKLWRSPPVTAAQPTGWLWPPPLPMSPPPPCWSGYPLSIWFSWRRSSSLGGRSGEFLLLLSWYQGPGEAETEA